jgi:hypothetical protein
MLPMLSENLTIWRIWTPLEGNGQVTITYTVSVPTSKDQCKKDGWKNYGPMFKNQGQCVSFVEHENHALRSHRHHH